MVVIGDSIVVASVAMMDAVAQTETSWKRGTVEEKRWWNQGGMKEMLKVSVTRAGF